MIKHILFISLAASVFSPGIHQQDQKSLTAISVSIPDGEPRLVVHRDGGAFLDCEVLETKAQGQEPKHTGRRDNVRSWQVGKQLRKSSLVGPGTEQYVLYMVRDGKKQPSALLTRRLELGEQAGEPIIRITQLYELAAGVNSDTSIVRRRTLEPLSYTSTSSTQKESFDFSPGLVRGAITPTQGEVKPFDAAIESPVFNAVILDEILKSLPLAEGLAFSIRAHNPGKQFFTLILRVLRSERIHTVGRAIDAWIVEMEGGAAPTTYWIAKHTQEVLMQKALLRGGGEFWRVRLYGNGS